MDQNDLNILYRQLQLDPSYDNAIKFANAYVRSGVDDDNIPITTHISASVKKSIPPNSNPFHYDAFHMGTQIASNIMIMHHTFEHQKADYIIIVNTDTGERIKLNF